MILDNKEYKDVIDNGEINKCSVKKNIFNNYFKKVKPKDREIRKFIGIGDFMNLNLKDISQTNGIIQNNLFENKELTEYMYISILLFLCIYFYILFCINFNRN